MRIKLATSTPLPAFHCWFPISEKSEKQTIHHLRKKIVKDLELKAEPSNIQLMIDGFNLLPQTIIKDLVRDGDLITLKTEIEEKKVNKKRKISSIEEKHDTKESPKIKKSKKSTDKKQVEKSKKSAATKPVEKSKKSTATKQVERSKKSTSKDKASKDRKKKEPTEIDLKKTQQNPIKKQSLPFEGIPKTKKRNMRRRLLKQMRAATTSLDETPVEPTIVTPVNNESLIENLSISSVEPLQLIKKNKNKKKNHLKQMDQRSHVHYVPEEIEAPVPFEIEASVPFEITPSTPQDENLYGRAFVTIAESEPKYKGYNNTSKYPPREYLINQVPTLFYANEALTIEEAEKEPVVKEAEVVQTTISPPVEKEEKAPEKPINYEQDFPEANFTSDIPSVGDKLAIKTLELTAAYTPEISDWKQAILINHNENTSQITIEYLPGFGKATTKGGKFDIRKKKKHYDDWYEQEEEEEEEEEEDQQVTIECADIFAMRNMS